MGGSTGRVQVVWNLTFIYRSIRPLSLDKTNMIGFTDSDTLYQYMICGFLVLSKNEQSHEIMISKNIDLHFALGKFLHTALKIDN